MIISLFAGQCMAATFLKINPNNSCLLVASHKKSAHFPGNLFLPSTLISSDSFPSFSLVDSLMLLGMYMSHTISTHVQRSNCFDMCGRKILSAYSSNVATLTVGSKYTTAAPSRSRARFLLC